MRRIGGLLLLLSLAASGCAGGREFVDARCPSVVSADSGLSAQMRLPQSTASPAQRTSEVETSKKLPDAAAITALYLASTQPADNEAEEEIPPGRPLGELRLAQVIESVNRSYPLLEAAFYARDIAFGEHLAAHGAFDIKLKGASENGPLGFYETYRNVVGLEKPTYGGGSVFAGYRIGRGEFQPWYLERQTDKAGEFKAGVAVPLARNVEIDSRRAQLWRTELGQQLAEPEIRLQRIDFVRAATYAYWDWLAAGRRFQIATSLLKIAEDRHEAIRRKVEAGDTDPPVLQDNRRLIVSREAKQIDADRKLQQAAVKLSLFWRDALGQPLLAESSQLPEFPRVSAPDESARDADIQSALANRPELRALDLLRQQLEIDLSEARNDLLPDLQAVVTASQDIGAPASSKNDKSEFELEAGLFLDVPVQRRKAQGKLTAVAGKLRQIAAKFRMTADKIAADVQVVHAALGATVQQVARARESVELANRLAEIERRKFDLGESDLLAVNLREQQAAEAQSTEVDALQDYFTALADYQAILASDVGDMRDAAR